MRNKFHLLFFFFGIIGCFPSCTSEEPTLMDEANTANLTESVSIDVSYGANEQQVYDLYLPEGRTSEKTKVILLVHGGGWIAGDKDNMEAYVTQIRERHPNHAIVNMNYVLGSIAGPVTPAFPNQFLDIDAVINKLTSEKETLQILPEFGLIGSSAGAHLALMYDAVYDTDDQVKFVVDIVGPTDFTDPFYANDPEFNLALSLLVDENQYPAGTNFAEAISPVYQVNALSSPAALFYGNKDPIVPLSNGTNLDTALSDSKITHSFTTYTGGHGDNWSEGDYLNLQVQIGEYIESYLAVD